jgi:hypothetical protein
MAFSEAISDFPSALASDNEQFEYRSFSTSAIASAIFGVLSLLTIVAARDSFDSALMICPIPILGVVLGIRALSAIRANPDQVSGRKFAIVGIALSLVGMLTGLSYAGYVHATEVPEGAIRTSFYEFRPSENDLDAGIPIPKDVQALDGKRVFIKGYMRADSTPVRRNVRRFLLVRDNNQCCFGDLASVKYYDQVLVDFDDKVTTDYSTDLFRIAGTLQLRPQNVNSPSQAPVYTIKADYVQ